MENIQHKLRTTLITRERKWFPLLGPKLKGAECTVKKNGVLWC
jgi:hypothetical protein